MQFARLGQRGPEVSRVGFGAWAIGGLDWGETDDRESLAALGAALDEGVTLIDTADVYGRGHSEELVRRALAGRDRARVVVATKAGNDFYNATPADDHGYGPIRPNADTDYIVFAAEQSLRRLGVERIDLLQLHSQPTEMLDRDDAWDALARLKRDGKIRYAGWSVQSFRESEQTYLLRRHADLLDAIQVRYNLLERDAERDLLPAARDLGVGVIVRIPLLFGLLTGKFDATTTFGADDHRRFNLAPDKLADHLTRLGALQWLFEELSEDGMAGIALRFCLSHPAVTTVIPGGRSPAQVRENVVAGSRGALPPEVLARLGA